MAKDANGAELLLGSGKIYFAELVSGALKGEEYLGDCTTFEITPSVTEISKRSSSTSARPKIASDVTDFSLALRIVGGQFNAANMARACGGEVGTLSQGGGTVADEVLNDVEAGKYYPLAKRNVSLVVVTNIAGNVTYVANTDYEVDTRSGRIYIVPGGAIADLSDLKVDYTYSAESKTVVRAGLKSQIKGFLRYISDNTRGDNHEVQVWKVRLSPKSAIGLISENYAEWSLEGEIEADLAAHPTEPYYRDILL